MSIGRSRTLARTAVCGIVLTLSTAFALPAQSTTPQTSPDQQQTPDKKAKDKAQQPPAKPKGPVVIDNSAGHDANPNEQIKVIQPEQTGDEAAKGRAVLQQMFAALHAPDWYQHRDYVVKGHTATFYQNNPTGVSDFWQYHHVLPNGEMEDRFELTKKRDVVQIWTPTVGYDVNYKGHSPLPKDIQEDFLRRQHYSLDAIENVWLKQPDLLVVYGGTAVVARRQVEKVTLIDKDNNSVEIDVESDSHLPLRRIFQYRDPKFNDFDEDVEEYSDFHDEDGVPVPIVTTRYHNGDMVSQRFIETIRFQPVDASLFDPTSRIGKHK